MKLDRIQRWTLANQMRILALLDDNEKSYYERAIEILEHGYEGEYGTLAQNVYEQGLTAEECSEVIHTMDMFTALQRSFKKLADKEGIDKEKLVFDGYDGNEETSFMTYAEFIHSTDRFTDLELGGDGFNSHGFEDRFSYKKMLAEWKNSKDRYGWSEPPI